VLRAFLFPSRLALDVELRDGFIYRDARGIKVNLLAIYQHSRSLG